MNDPIKVLEEAIEFINNDPRVVLYRETTSNLRQLLAAAPHLLRLVRAMEAENAMLRSFSGIVEFPPNRKRIEEHKAYTDQARAALADAVGGNT